SNPTATNDISQGQFSYDPNEGVVRFDNMMGTTSGPMVNAFSTSQPVILRRTNMPDQLIEPDSAGNRWTPLLWFAVMHGVEPTGGAFTSGSSVFVPGTSVIPSITQASFTNYGMIEAWTANPSSNNSF